MIEIILQEILDRLLEQTEVLSGEDRAGPGWFWHILSPVTLALRPLVDSPGAVSSEPCVPLAARARQAPLPYHPRHLAFGALLAHETRK